MSEQLASAKQMVVVLGMHRSGTSAIAGTLAQLGVDFTERLIPPAEDNPKGFFEHADIWVEDHALLTALGSDWDDPSPLRLERLDQALLARVADQVKAILRRDFSGLPLAGIKDPRMCRLVPLWQQWLTEEGWQPRYVLALREPMDVIGSLIKRDALPAEQAATVWLRHVLEAERDTRHLPRAVLSYERLLADWRSELDQLQQALAIQWPRPVAQVAPSIAAFLEPSLRHNRTSGRPHELAPKLGEWVSRVHQALLAPGGIQQQVLDEVAAELALGDTLAAHGEAALRHMRARAVQLDSSLQWLQREHAGLSAGHAELQENLQRHVDELGRTREGSAWLQSQVDHHAADMQVLTRHLDEVRETLEAREHALAELQQEHAALGAHARRVEADLSVIFASLSWKLTKPLRWSMRQVRRLRGAPAAAPAPVPDDSPLQPLLKKGALRVEAQPEVTRAPASGPRVLIVTPDILGPIRNGGIGTAFGALARTLAQAGHAVTVLYTLGNHSEDGQGVQQWVEQYASLGIRFIPIALEHGQPVLDAPHHAWRAYRVYLWLKQHQADYDLAYFPEWKGEAYYALQAKRLGLDFAALRMIVVTHSSTTWAESGNYVVPQQFDDLLLEFLERRSTEMADAVISPSQYMLDWMRQRGWCWSAPTYVIQNLMPEGVFEPSPVPAAAVTEWVFFGRLERRKGLLVFLQALRQVPAELRGQVRVTFLGKAVHSAEFDSLRAIREAMVEWPREAKILADFDREKALAYLHQPGRVAVIASLVENSPYTVLECLLKGIPFIAADVGGIAELIDVADHPRALFKPTPSHLAKSLVALEQGRYAAPRPAEPAADTEQRWLALQSRLLDELPDASAADDDAPWPRITVCLVHYNRPALLGQALDSLRAQRYRHFDVVLVDDGSPSAEARQYLDSLSDEFAWRGWTLLRQDNAYLGAARNAAARLASGDYLMFMDDDNIAKPHELETFARAARHSGADVLTTVSDCFADDGRGAHPPSQSQQLWVPIGNAPGLGVFRNVFGDANALIRRRVFEQIGGFTEDYGVGHEDWELFAKASLAGCNLQLVPEPLFWYRVNPSSMLRAGQAHMNYARSVRPYWESIPEGLGGVLAYASHMQRSPAPAIPIGSPAAPVPIGRRQRLWLAATAVFRPQLRARLRQTLREHGVRMTVGRSLRYIGLLKRR